MPTFYNGATEVEQIKIGADDTRIMRGSNGDIIIQDKLNGTTFLSDLFATASSKFVKNENLSSQLDGLTTILTIVNTVGNMVICSLNGGVLIENVDFTVSGTTYTFIGKYAETGNIPESGESLYITYFKE